MPVENKNFRGSLIWILEFDDLSKKSVETVCYKSP